MQDEPHVVAHAAIHRREVEAKGLETHVSLCAVSLRSVWLYEMLFSQPCLKRGRRSKSTSASKPASVVVSKYSASYVPWRYHRNESVQRILGVGISRNTGHQHFLLSDLKQFILKHQKDNRRNPPCGICLSVMRQVDHSRTD